MLKSELIRPRLRMKGGKVWAERLPAGYDTLTIVQDLMGIYRAHIGQSRGALADALKAYEGDSLDYMVIRGLARVLGGACAFGNEPAIKPQTLRAEVFGRGPVRGKDLVPGRVQILREVAEQYKLTLDEVETALFADLAEEQRLLACNWAWSPGEVIGRYNVEVARGLLYWAREVRVQVWDGFKDFFKFVKLFRLMYSIRPGENNSYHVTLHGPLSPFVKSTIRYGLQFAKFMPALLLGERWQMEADVKPPGSGRVMRYELDETTLLKSHFKGSGAFDSQLEADFSAEFEEKYTRADRLWELSREDELILLGDSVMIPDFAFTHKTDGRRALLELVGFWHPDYLRRKLAKVQAAQRHDLILLVYESASVAEGGYKEKFAETASEVLFFKRKPVLKDVLAAVERVGVVGSG